MVLQGHEQGKVGQPVGIRRPEIIKVRAAPEPGIGKPQYLHPAVVQQAKVRLILPAAPGNISEFFRLKQALLHQGVQVNEIMVPGEGGTGLVGRVPIAGGCQREDLPIALPRFLQEVNKSIGIFAHGTNAVGAGQAGDVHQNAAGSHILFASFSRKNFRSEGVRRVFAGTAFSGFWKRFQIQTPHRIPPYLDFVKCIR